MKKLEICFVSQQEPITVCLTKLLRFVFVAQDVIKKRLEIKECP